MNIIYRMSRNFNDLSTRRKLVLSYILVVFVPVMLVGLLLTYSLRKMAINSAISEANGNVERVSKRMEDIFEIPVTISLKLYGSSQLKNIINEEYDNQWDIIRTYFDYNEFNELMGLYNQIEDIRLYVKNDSMIDNWRFVKITDDIKRLPWFKNAVNRKGGIIWSYIDMPGKIVETPSLSMIRLLKTARDKEMGILVVKIKNVELNKIFKQESFETMLINDEGIVIAAKDSSIIGKSINDLSFNFALREHKQIENVKYKNKSFKIISYPFYGATTKQCFHVISLFSINGITSKANQISILGFIIIVISLIMSFIMIIIFSKMLSSRINMISKDMHKVAMGNFDFVTQVDGKDEVGQLAKDLNLMVAGIKNLLKEISETNQQKNSLIIKQREIKLKMLASQINPHFLFNSLESIRMKAVSNGEREIAKITILLGKIMRSNLKVSSELVTLETEIDLIRSYLEIQKFRYGDKISYDIVCINSQLLKWKTLPCLIQPIVENAVIHGLEKKEESGSLYIIIDNFADEINIKIVDDGIGMSENKLKQLNATLDDPDNSEGRRIGIRNVHQRIKLFYGNNYGLQIISIENKGTTVNITFPKGDGLIV
jgi:two-component system, sensor histidine kinase YesM